MSEFSKIEKKWQSYWEKNECFKAINGNEFDMIEDLNSTGEIILKSDTNSSQNNKKNRVFCSHSVHPF